eukprot:scaffold269526_cov30-Tisochrysis_lutea.AAC.4
MDAATAIATRSIDGGTDLHHYLAACACLKTYQEMMMRCRGSGGSLSLTYGPATLQPMLAYPHPPVADCTHTF